VAPGPVAVSNGGSGTIQFTLAPIGTLDATILLSFPGLPQGAQCVFSPAALTLANGPVTVTARVTTGAHTQTASWKRGVPPFGAGAMLACLGFLNPFGRKRRAASLLGALLLVLTGRVMACKRSGSSTPGASPTSAAPTPAGTYDLTITASAPGAIPATASFQLTVAP